MITHRLAAIAAAFALAACDRATVTPDVKTEPIVKRKIVRAEFPQTAPDWKTAQCIADEMDSMFERGDLKDESTPEQTYYTYRLAGDPYKKVVADCEKKTGQKTLFPETTGATSHHPKVWPPK